MPPVDVDGGYGNSAVTANFQTASPVERSSGVEFKRVAVTVVDPHGVLCCAALFKFHGRVDAVCNIDYVARGRDLPRR